MGNACMANAMKSGLETALAAPKGDVKWFTPYGEESKAVIKCQDKKYGQNKKKTFMEVAKAIRHYEFLSDKTGNSQGELGGNIVFTTTGSDLDANDYSKEVGTPPLMDPSGGKMIWGLALFHVPLNLIPAGENNMGVFGHGVVCASVRLMALYVEIDGNPITKQVMDQKSKKYLESHSADYGNQPKCVETAPEGSFYAWNEAKPRFGCLKFPIIEQKDVANCDRDTSCDGKELSKLWMDTFGELPPGEHTVSVKICAWYDWAALRCFVYNFREDFAEEKDYNKLSEKPPNPMEPVKIEEPVGAGSFKMVIPDNYKELVEELADTKPPKEGYFRDDKEGMRKTCAGVAGGKNASMPDYTIIMTDLTQEGRWENKTNYKYAYDYIEFAACYLNADNKDDPEAEAMFWVGAMVRGETEPRKITKNWVWNNAYRLGGIMSWHSSPTKNKYILRLMGKC